MNRKAFALGVIVSVVAVFIITACVPVRVLNRNFDSTYVFLKFSPEDAYKGIKKGDIKGKIFVDDAYLPPRYCYRDEGRVSRFIIVTHGKHKLTIDVDGYKRWEKEIFFSGRYLKLNVELEKE
ncbi:MAG: hypothetical protein D6734_05945 [Candidatus Schekmanbacteria bacterium]|nr:MAG: hypothetical protein D6734_05945 [Candidatus Schekmanbacteria bacterium]